jgi:hypothetical protein
MLPNIEKDPSGRPRVTIRSGIFTVRPDGILLGEPTSVDVALADAKEMVEVMKKLRPQVQAKLLLDQRKVTRKLSPEARDYLAANTDQFDKIAVLVGSAISRFLASGILMVTGRRRRIQVFENEAAAVAWLNERPAMAATTR